MEIRVSTRRLRADEYGGSSSVAAARYTVGPGELAGRRPGPVTRPSDRPPIAGDGIPSPAERRGESLRFVPGALPCPAGVTRAACRAARRASSASRGEKHH